MGQQWLSFDDGAEAEGDLDTEAFDKACELVRAADVAGGSWQEALIWLSRSHPELKPLGTLASQIGVR